MMVIIFLFHSVRLAAHGKIVKADSLSEYDGFFFNWTLKYV